MTKAERLRDVLAEIVGQFDTWEKRTPLPRGKRGVRRNHPVTMNAAIKVGTLRKARTLLRTD